MSKQPLDDYVLGVVLALEVAHHCFISGNGVEQIEEILDSKRLGEAVASCFPGGGIMLVAIRQGFTDTLQNLVERTSVKSYPYSPQLSQKFLDALPQEWRADISE